MQFLAGPVRFELTMLFSTPVFKTGAFNHSATDPLVDSQSASQNHTKLVLASVLPTSFSEVRNGINQIQNSEMAVSNTTSRLPHAIKSL